ncbi:uncharacterized protein LAJ45_05130 [Morchella importuna]|uniref:uncharacterized protein n=1 Tax=Morchella importuna TaxID=1174673 RepID=UPI001E8E61A8|nr:uncharacterized protein LAJ45_05130 [Morchella importuna]KAH8150947.1 hypothetical protein LAJ45_05130 [Morchella importuna]
MLLPRLLLPLRSSTSTIARSTSPRQCLKLLPTAAAAAMTQQRFFAAAAAVEGAELNKTPLDALHRRNGGKMVPFAGYSMPVLYEGMGVGDSHRFVRERCGLFDVSHMVQHRFEGPGALQFLQTITPTDLTLLEPNQSTLSVLLHPVTGGIVDDLIITLENPSSFYVVTNAACKAKDTAYFTHHLTHFNATHSSTGAAVRHTVLHNQGLIALQGPLAKDILQEYLDSTPARGKLDLSTLYFGYATTVAVPLGADNVEELHIARGGYTGEDGFEISISPRNTEAVTQALLDAGKSGGRVQLAGLGARDSLRLEAGMCLYGHDIDDGTTPIEAGLKWLVGGNRVMEGTFNGHETISRQYNDWKQVTRRRVGLIVDGAPAREGAEILEKGSDTVIGKVTSGCPSPTLGLNIAMGYVQSGFHKSGTEVGVKVRGKVRVGRVARMPFVGVGYYKKP